MSHLSILAPQLSLTLQKSEPMKRPIKSFGSSLSLKRTEIGLKVDLSEDLMKFSE